jgi:hypothetical protein
MNKSISWHTIMAEDECKFPSSWTDNKIAGIDWLQGFMKDTRTLRFASLNIQVYSGLPRSTKET